MCVEKQRVEFCWEWSVKLYLPSSSSAFNVLSISTWAHVHMPSPILQGLIQTPPLHEAFPGAHREVINAFSHSVSVISYLIIHVQRTCVTATQSNRNWPICSKCSTNIYWWTPSVNLPGCWSLSLLPIPPFLFRLICLFSTLGLSVQIVCPNPRQPHICLHHTVFADLFQSKQWGIYLLFLHLLVSNIWCFES